ncbi:FecR family protein [Bacteroides sp. 224]|uniref:FecR family protein n=1 Tax=Bacteroides sp. 224 TaxID=2302936 RepID=UPI0013D87661|nr:FecR family protein [Bacteroides sp. 224]NDV65870.1 FecR family protein [Bacteroides sp. 224]
MKEKTMKEIDDNMLRKFITGECSEQEYAEINHWINEKEENARALFEMEEIYQLGKFDSYLDTKRMDRAERRLFQQIEKEEATIKKKQIHIKRWMQYAASIAAIMVIVSGLGYWFHTTNPANDLIVETNTENTAKEIILPDGSKVWINNATTLRYPRAFTNKERQVYMEGEAYFEVAKNAEKPFIVHGEALTVKVLGTIFNMKNDLLQNVAEASLIEGEIEVRGNNSEGMITLSPGQRAELNRNNGKLTVKQVDTKLDAVWRNELIPFEQANILSIAKTLERFYQVKITLSPDIRLDITYSGVLKRKSAIESVLKSLKNSIPINYRIDGNNIFISPEND